MIDPLEGARCHFCDKTADNFHVPDELWARVAPVLGQQQACFKCFRIAAWHVGIRPSSWEVMTPARFDGVLVSIYAHDWPKNTPLPEPADLTDWDSMPHGFVKKPWEREGDVGYDGDPESCALCFRTEGNPIHKTPYLDPARLSQRGTVPGA